MVRTWMAVMLMLAIMAGTTIGQCSDQEKVYFQAWNKDTLTNVANNQILVYDETNSNKGDAYDTNTGSFTAPRDGAYVFAWTVVTQDKFSINVHLYVNGNSNSLAQADGVSGPQNSSGSNTVVLELKSGDIVNLRCGEWGPQEKRQVVGQGHSTFAGWSL